MVMLLGRSGYGCLGKSTLEPRQITVTEGSYTIALKSCVLDWTLSASSKLLPEDKLKRAGLQGSLTHSRLTVTIALNAFELLP